jgi:hypothetical protein
MSVSSQNALLDMWPRITQAIEKEWEYLNKITGMLVASKGDNGDVFKGGCGIPLRSRSVYEYP